MELIERSGFLISLQSQFEKTVAGEGHCVFICGESGIGKTALVNAFCKQHTADCKIYRGTCDALFTPRPLAPLYDIAWQISNDFWVDSKSIEDRAGLFAKFLQELSQQNQPVILIFEDIHWADDATLDFIKFFTRRIARTQCLFLLTYRDNEINAQHPLRSVLGELMPGTFTRLLLTPLSKESVEKLAAEKGYRGEDVYSISGGNPFYVNEILASYSPGVPDNIKDAILTIHHRQHERVKAIWDMMSVLPTGLELKYLEKIDPLYEDAIENCMAARILVLKGDLLTFKHELFRRTIEESLSPLKRIALNRKILEILQGSLEASNETERIIHHAKNANDYDIVLRYAPKGAKQAAAVGAHTEAAKLYLTAIEYYQGSDKDLLLQFYEAYSYECYLTNQIREAIIYQGKSLSIWKSKQEIEKMGNCLRFLSRLWWFEGNHQQAEKFAAEAIEMLEQQPASKVKGMTYSNMSQLKMLNDEVASCLYWGTKAVAIAHDLDDKEILSHALNNMGTVEARKPGKFETACKLLEESLSIALQNGYHEHAARSYTNLSSMQVVCKKYLAAARYLNEGIAYCEERDLYSWTKYMLSWKARLLLQTGSYADAYQVASQLLENEYQSPVVKIGALTVMALILMRSGNPSALPLLNEAKSMAFIMQEHQRIVPVMTAMLEYEWITGDALMEEEALQQTIYLIEHTDNIFLNSEFAFWLMKVRNQHIPLQQWYAGYDNADAKTRQLAILNWQQLDCPYEQALLLFEGKEDDKRKALALLQPAACSAVLEKMKQEMRGSGIKKIPRGIRETTRSNPAQLTNRELDILQLLQQSMQNKEIAAALFISAKTVDHHISSVLFKLDVNSRTRAVQEARRLGILK